ncbi:MAG TPA: glycine--tRNA ligase [Candidatus Poseidoniaceae archaeon]|nr:MAG TPA: glycine--tRNA ligase [Candidatus Poseidoniales archaeon]HII37181.1 glycine--tRNA ligase [Candidatus Poseidoniaceae archaeon]|tara:strand:+ start:925 stop:2604 length:1680 start_codon:yes stop_codon:yes gene_type:complete
MVRAMAEESGSRLERMSGMLKRRGFILPAFEIHGGSKGLYDFGPNGGRLRNRVNQIWLDHWISLGNVAEISCPTITPYEVLEASGHVGEFSDFMTACLVCDDVSRADTLLENDHTNPDSLSKIELDNLLKMVQPECPSCGANQWGPVIAQNLMFNTTIGAGNSGRAAFLRPETAQGMFTSFPSLYRHFREKLPFGAIQVGKGYRNEISPRQGMIRLREFNMAELEYFIDPEMPLEHDFTRWSDYEFNLISEAEGEIKQSISAAVDAGIIRHGTVGYFIAMTHDFLAKVGIDESRIRFRQHETTEMAHYATDCWDAEILGSYGWVECVGIAHRGCYDLEAHEQFTGKSLRARRDFTEPKQVVVDGWTIDGAVAGPIFRSLANKVKTAVEKLPKTVDFPLILDIDGTPITVEKEHVKRLQRTETVTGEWFIPHVVEPAFGIDRIIWHILDHAYQETTKQDEIYTLMRLSSNIVPVDYAVFPLFEKDGMGQIARMVNDQLNSKSGIVSTYDSSGSIGRRYARADEIGIPICVTVDHQSVEDNTVTIRDRDTGKQKRVSIADL